MPKINPDAIAHRDSCIYPGALANIVKGRQKKALGDSVGLSQFGVNLTTLAPGAASAHRHWHAKEDEFVFVVSGTPTLIEDANPIQGDEAIGDTIETLMAPGDMAGFKAGDPVGHHIINKSEDIVVLLEVGTRLASDDVTYTDKNVDMQVQRRNGQWRVLRKDGSSY